MAPRQSYPLENSVFFTNIPYTTTVGYIRKVFSKVGTVEDVDLYTDGRGASIGAGVVTFDSADAARKAVEELDSSQVDGRSMAVKVNERESRWAKGAGKGSPDARVFFNGVPYATSEGFLRAKFEKFGEIVDFNFWRRLDGTSQGMGTCAYATAAQAQAALEALNGSLVDGRRILVQMDDKPAEPKGDATKTTPKPTIKGDGLLKGSKGIMKGIIVPKGGLKGVGKGRKVFWSNASPETTEGYLRAQFEKLGTIVDFDFWRKLDGTSQGKGTCEFDHYLGAWRAIERLHGQTIDGSDLLIKEDDGGRPGQVWDFTGKGKGKGLGKGKGKWY